MTARCQKNGFSKGAKRLARITQALIFFILALATDAFAQKLLIETPSAGPVARVFYGQLTLQGLTLFETKYAFQKNESVGLAHSVTENLSDQPSPAPSATSNKEGKSPILASFVIPDTELQKCTQTARFRGFLTLASTLRGKVNSATLKAGPGSEACAERTRDSLRKLFAGTEININSDDVQGVKIELGMTDHVTTAKQQQPAEPPREITLTLDQLIRASRLKIGENNIRINSEGWFIAEVLEMSETTLELISPGRKVLSLKTTPVAITAEPKPVTNASNYKARAAIFSKPELKIYISETPFLAQKTTLDGGAGGGVGYGREVPGEKRGERLVSMLGIERREIYGDLGGRLGLFYTNAGKTVVPHTFTVRGLAFYDSRFFDDSLNLRFAVGMELFQSKITQPKTRSTKSNADAVLVPSQVSSPLTGISVSKIFKNGIIISPSVYVAPLYISKVGLYPAFSPSVEIGYKIRKDLALLLNAGSETHRFPSVAGETKLQMDYAFFSLKRGLF